MAKESLRPDPRLRKSPETEDNTPHVGKEEKLVEVRKKDNNLKFHEKPFDEQGYTSFEEIRKAKGEDKDDPK